MEINVLGVMHIGICVSNIEESLRLYRDVLGFRQISDINTVSDDTEAKGHGFPDVKGFTYRVCYVKEEASGTEIELVEFVEPKVISHSEQEKMPKDSNQLNIVGTHHIAWKVDDIESAFEKLAGSGYEPVYHPLRDGNIQWGFLKDHEGTLFELIQEDTTE